jgi:DNA replication and repair protein RecF
VDKVVTMRITQLFLYKFRNYDELSLDLNQGLNVILGHNGQGKTNLIEAIYLLSQGRMFRPGQLNTIINKNNNPLFHTQVSAKFLKDGAENKIKFNIQNNKKKYLLNEKVLSSKMNQQKFQTVLFSPESLSAIKSGPEQRRGLIDEILVLDNPENQKILNEYTKTLRTKNRILKDYRAEKISKVEFLSLIDSLNEIFLQQSLNLTQLRLHAIEAIIESVQSIYSHIQHKNVDISVEYQVSGQNILGWQPEEIQSLLEKRQSELFSAEMHSGSSLTGAHRHDIAILCDGEDSRYYCSQGQQRAIILSFKIAQILNYIKKFKEAPILLLDDVLSELDKEKRTYLVDFINAVEAQIFITSTELALDKKQEFKEDVSIFVVNNGTIKKEFKGELRV